MAHDVFAGDEREVDHPKMDVPDVGAVVIDDGDGGFIEFIDRHFLHQFPPHAIVVAEGAGEEAVILLRNVSTDADGIQSVQPGLLPALTRR
jgi:hypothetical protein